MPPPNAQTGFSHSLSDPQLCEPVSRLACDDKHTPQIDLHHRRPHQALAFMLQLVKRPDLPDAHICVADDVGYFLIP